jgi:OFA family oxalate/formate antiporter-like MFS transporter
MKTVNKGLLLVIGTLMLLFLGLIYAWSIFRAPLAGIFPDWTPTQISMTFTISIVCFCVGGFLAGKLTARLKHSRIILLSALSILLGFSLITVFFDANAPVKTLTLLYICYGILGGGGVGLSYNTLIGVVARHFPGKAGMASGVLLLGFGVGGLALGSLVRVFDASVGIRFAFLYLGLILTVVLVIGSFFIRLPDAASSSAPAKSSADTPAPLSTPKSYTLREVMLRPTFWMLFLWVIFMCIGGLLVINSAAPIAERFGMLAVLGLIVSVFNGAGRPLIGILLDVLGRAKAMLLNTCIMFLGGVSLLAGQMTENTLFIYIGLPLMGICYGGTPALLSAVVNNFYGPKNFQVILGAATFSLAVAAIIGPLLSSKLQESSGGEYTSSFIMIVVVAVAAVLVNFLIAFFGRKDGLEKS